MVLERVGARLVAGCEAVMDVAPVIRRHGVRLEPDCRPARAADGCVSREPGRAFGRSGVTRPPAVARRRIGRATRTSSVADGADLCAG